MSDSTWYRFAGRVLTDLASDDALDLLLVAENNDSRATFTGPVLGTASLPYEDLEEHSGGPV